MSYGVREYYYVFQMMMMCPPRKSGHTKSGHTLVAVRPAVQPATATSSQARPAAWPVMTSDKPRPVTALHELLGRFLAAWLDSSRGRLFRITP